MMSLRVILVTLCVFVISCAQQDETPHTRFRDKRTLDFIVHGLAQLLGYRLERENSSASLVSTPAPIVLIVNNDKRKQDAENHHTSDKIQNYDYNHYFKSDQTNNDLYYFKSDKSNDKLTNNQFNYYKSDFNHGRPYDRGFTSNSKSYELFNNDHRNQRKNNDFDKNDELFRKGNSDNKSKSNRDRVNDYLTRVSYVIKNQLKDVKVGKNENQTKINDNKKDTGNFDRKTDYEFGHLENLDEDGTEELHKIKDESSSENVNKTTEPINNSAKCNDTQKSTQQQSHNDKATSEKQKQAPSKDDKQQNEFHYFNQIPAPSLQNWEQEFWNNQHYTVTANNAYNFQIPDFNIDESNKPLDFTFHTSEQNNPLSENSYARPQYSENHNFEPLHEWGISSDAISDKSQQQSTEQSASTNNKNSSVQKQNLAMTEHSTVRPKLAELIHDIEGTKQNPLWPPPPFDQAFEGTDSSIKTQQNSPLVLNLYNYTTISDYLLDMSNKQLQKNSESKKSYVADKVPQPSFYGVLYPQQISVDKKQGDKKTPRLQQQESNHHASLGLYYRDFYN